jgi:hypothetical protein
VHHRRAGCCLRITRIITRLRGLCDLRPLLREEEAADDALGGVLGGVVLEGAAPAALEEQAEHDHEEAADDIDEEEGRADAGRLGEEVAFDRCIALQKNPKKIRVTKNRFKLSEKATNGHLSERDCRNKELVPR